MSGPASPETVQTGYDRSGRWPIEAGWQVIFLARKLFPGGPWACKVVTPAVVFFFGLDFEPGASAADPRTAVITNLGQASLAVTNRNVLAGHARAEAFWRIKAYVLENSTLFWPYPLADVVLGSGDGSKVDIF